MSTQDLAPFDVLQAEVTQLVAPALTISVKDPATLEAAQQTFQQLKALVDRVDDRRIEIVKPLNDRVNAVNALAKKIKEPLEKARAHVKDEIRNHEIKLDEQRKEIARKAEIEREKKEREAREAQEREAREADAKRAEERRILEEQAAENVRVAQEKARLDADVAALFGGGGVDVVAPAQAVSDAEAAAAAKRAELEQKQERDRLAEKARAEREAGEREREHGKVLKQPELSRTKGTRRKWTFEILDATALPREFLMPNDRAIDAAVSAGTREIPGVRIFEDVIVVSRRGSLESLKA